MKLIVSGRVFRVTGRILAEPPQSMHCRDHPRRLPNSRSLWSAPACWCFPTVTLRPGTLPPHSRLPQTAGLVARPTTSPSRGPAPTPTWNRAEAASCKAKIPGTAWKPSLHWGESAVLVEFARRAILFGGLDSTPAGNPARRVILQTRSHETPWRTSQTPWRTSLQLHERAVSAPSVSDAVAHKGLGSIPAQITQRWPAAAVHVLPVTPNAAPDSRSV